MPPVQIFISYAWSDNTSPPDLPNAKGFVTFLHQQLAYELRSFGEPMPHLWRDTKHVERGNQFDPIIDSELKSSAVLVVVLSRIWMSRPNCRAELDNFVTHWRAAGENDQQIRKRIVLICKHCIAPANRPEMLQGQEGYALFEGEAGREQEFYFRGEIRDKIYHDCVRDLASYLWREAAKAATPSGSGRLSPRRCGKSRRSPRRPPAGARSLSQNRRATCRNRICAWLRSSRVSATGSFLLRRKKSKAKRMWSNLSMRRSPQPNSRSICWAKEPASSPKIPSRSSRCSSSARPPACPHQANGGQSSVGGFRRFIWAPKVVEVEKKQEDGTVLAQSVTGRDPLRIARAL